MTDPRPTGTTYCPCGAAWIGTIDHGMAEQRSHAYFHASGGPGLGVPHDPGLATFTPDRSALAAPRSAPDDAALYWAKYEGVVAGIVAAPRSVETAEVAIRSYQLWDRESGNLLHRYDPDVYSVIGIDQDGHPHRLVVYAALAAPRSVETAGLDAIVDRCRQHIAGLGADLMTVKAREATSAQRAAAADRAYAHLRGIDEILTAALSPGTTETPT